MTAKKLIFILVTIAFFFVGCQNTSQPPAEIDQEQELEQQAFDCSNVKRLISWYSPSRGDNFATANTAWDAPIGTVRSPDYKAYRHEGLIFTTPRTGTVPLYLWYSPSRADNFITTNPGWAGTTGATRSPDYRFVRVEGYIYDPTRPKPARTLALDSSYSSTRGDNFASTSGNFTGAIGKTTSPDYKLYRHEGYLLDLASHPCARVSKLLVQVSTGDDDKRAESSLAADVLRKDATPIMSGYGLFTGTLLPDRSTAQANIPLEGEYLAKIGSLKLQFDGTDRGHALFYDDWNISHLVIKATTPAGLMTIFDKAGSPYYIRFTDDVTPRIEAHRITF